MANGGVSIGVSASTQQAQRGIAGLTQAVSKLAAQSKGLFGGQAAQAASTYTRHLQQLERSLDRVTLRVKSLQAAQAGLLQQQRQLQAGGATPTGAGAAQLHVVNRALAQNAQSLATWQAKQLGLQNQINPAQQNGGGGLAVPGMLGSLAGKYWLPATVASAALGALGSGMSVADKEQKLLADILPRERLDGLAGTNTAGLMNRLRGVARPLGFSGVEALGFAQDMSTTGAVFGHGLERDSWAAMEAARVMGLDAGGLAAAGRMGAFQPGDARRFANMLAKEIKGSGMGGRSQEIEEATLMLMHRQLSTAGTVQAGTALAEQAVLAKTGLPAFQGMNGANFLAQMQSSVTGASDDASIGFLEAAARRMGVTGYYNLRDLVSRGPLSNPRFAASIFQTARDESPSLPAAIDTLSRVLHMPYGLLADLAARTHGYRDLNDKNIFGQLRAVKAGGDLLGTRAAESMGLTGNQLRLGDAARADGLAKIGGPIVKGLADLSTHAVHAYDRLSDIAGSSKTAADKLSEIRDYLLGPFYMPPSDPRRKRAMTGGYVPGPNGTRVWEPWGTPTPDRIGKHNSVMPPVPGRFGRHNSVPPVLPPVPGTPDGPAQQRSSIDGGNTVHLKVSFDHSGQLHPHTEQQLAATIEKIVDGIERRRTRGGLHHRYPRV